MNSCTRSSEAAATSRARLGLDDDADDADDVDAARAILADAVAWREEVSRRVKGVQEGRRLAKEWRSLGDEDLPYGHEWLCPESGEPI